MQHDKIAQLVERVACKKREIDKAFERAVEIRRERAKLAEELDELEKQWPSLRMAFTEQDKNESMLYPTVFWEVERLAKMIIEEGEPCKR